MLKRILKNRIASNAVWIIACKIVQALLGLLLSMLTARYLEPEKYGVLNYAISIALFVTPVAQLGLNYTLVSELVIDPDHEGEIMGTAMLSSMVSGALCILGIAVFAFTTSAGEPETIAVCILYSLLLLAQGAELIQYWFQAKLLSKYSALWTMIAYIVMCAYQGYCILSHRNVLWFALAKGIEYSLISVLLIVIYRRLGGKRLSFSWKRIRQMLRKSQFFMLSFLMVMLISQADRVMIKWMIGNAAMGYYSAAVTCANLTEFVFIAIIDSFRPVILEGRQQGTAQYENGMSLLYFIVIFMALAQSAVITPLAKYIVRILYGAAYLPAVPALQIIIWYTAFSYIGMVRNVWILAQNKERYLWFINLCGAAVNILMNSFLIPRLGIAGASLASLITQIFVNVIIGFLFPPIHGNNRLLVKGLDPRNFSHLLEYLKR